MVLEDLRTIPKESANVTQEIRDQRKNRIQPYYNIVQDQDF